MSGDGWRRVEGGRIGEVSRGLGCGVLGVRLRKMGVGVGVWLFWAGRGLALLVMGIVCLGGDVAGRVVTVRVVRVAI